VILQPNHTIYLFQNHEQLLHSFFFYQWNHKICLFCIPCHLIFKSVLSRCYVSIRFYSNFLHFHLGSEIFLCFLFVNKMGYIQNSFSDLLLLDSVKAILLHFFLDFVAFLLIASLNQSFILFYFHCQIYICNCPIKII